MIVEHRLRKFHPLEEGQAIPRMIWCRWFKNKSDALAYAAADSTTEVVWVGDAALTEEHTYDIKRFEVNL
jgi:hypothetical protein